MNGEQIIQASIDALSPEEAKFKLKRLARAMYLRDNGAKVNLTVPANAEAVVTIVHEVLRDSVHNVASAYPEVLVTEPSE